MTTPKKKFRGRHEELPAVGKFLHVTFLRDLVFFTDYSPDFNETYGIDFGKAIDRVNAVVYPEMLTKEGKKVTLRIFGNLDRLRILNTLTESYVNRAGDNLTVASADFGCKALRKKLKKGDVEGVIKELRILLQNIDANLPVLTQKGFKEATHTELVALPDSLTADNTLQSINIQDRNQLVNDNIALFDELYAIMRDVSETGKVIHNTISGTPERVSDFMISVLLRRVRHERKQQEGDGEAPTPGA